MKGARGLLINITGGSDITLFEMDQAANRIREEVDEDANIMVGMALDESLAGRMRISVVATGIDSAAPSVAQMPKLQVVGGGLAEAVAFPPQAHGKNAPAAAQPTVAQGAGYIPQPPEKPLLSAAYPPAVTEAAAMEKVELDLKPARPAAHALPAHLRAAEPQKRTSIFSRVFGGAPPAPSASAAEPAPPQARPAHREPVMTPRHQEPELHVPEPREPARAAVRPAQIDEIGLEIPAFLRRSQ